MPLTDKQKEDWKRWNGDKEFKIGRQYHKSGWLTKAPERGPFGSKKRYVLPLCCFVVFLQFPPAALFFYAVCCLLFVVFVFVFPDRYIFFFLSCCYMSPSCLVR